MGKKLTGIKNPVLKTSDTYMTLDFGNTYSDGSFHKGIDLRDADRDEVAIIAPCECTVTQLKNSFSGTTKSTGTDGMGNYVYANTDAGYRLRFQHMKKGSVVVKKGQTIKKGDKIGIIGTTGNSTGVHLHFDISKSGKVSGGRYVSSQNRTYFDPKPFLMGEKALTKETAKKGEKYKVTASCLRIRSGAGLGYSIVGRLYRNSKVTVTDIKNGWAKIGDGKWCSMDYLKEV